MFGVHSDYSLLCCNKLNFWDLRRPHHFFIHWRATLSGVSNKKWGKKMFSFIYAVFCQETPRLKKI